MATVVGVDIGGTKACVCTRSEGRESFEEFRTGPAMDGAQIAAELRARLERSCVRAAAIAVAVPGLVEDGRVVVSDVLPALAGWHPAASLGALAPCVLTSNDAKAALVEVAAGEPADATVALVMVGTGIGAALLVHGRALGGVSGWAGELGSIPIDRAEGVVRLDDAASGAAILRALAIDAAGVHARLAAGERTACEVVERAGEAMGCGLATLVNLFNPGKLVVAGGTLRYAGYAQAAIAALERWALPPLLGACRVVMPPDGERLVCRGAARLALSSLSAPDRPPG